MRKKDLVGNAAKLNTNSYTLALYVKAELVHHNNMMFSPCRLIIVALLLCSQSVVAEEQQHVAAAAAVCSEDNSSPSSECSEESTTNKKLETIRLGLEWFTNPDHLPLIVAQKHGIFKSLGLDVQLIEPADHWEAEEEILAGRLDVAVTEPLHLAQDAARGKPVLGFTRFLHTDGGVLYDAGKGDIQRPADMCGKTISYPGR